MKIKKLISLLTAVVCLCGVLTSCGNKAEETATTSPEEIHTEAASAKYDYLVLVNKQNKLPDDWEANVVLADAKNDMTGIEMNEDNSYLETDVFKVETKTLKAFRELQADCADDGITILLDSTYRSVARQEELWAEFAKEYGEDYCKKYVAVPGYSEHHTGLVVDICIVKDGVIINDNDQMIAEKEIFSKIHSKLAEHGFILRYLEGKDDITGYSYEPWHFRYVGVDVAKEIAAKGITFEEYLGKVPETTK